MATNSAVFGPVGLGGYPAQSSSIIDRMAKANLGGSGAPVDPRGAYFDGQYVYNPVWEQEGGYGTGQNYVPGENVFKGYQRTLPGRDQPGDTAQVFDAQGNLLQSYQIPAPDWGDKWGPRIALAIIGAAAGGAATSALGSGATSGAGGFIGEGASSGIPAWDGALANAGTAGTVGAGGTGGLDFTQGFTDGGTAGGTMTPGTPTYDPWSTGSAGTPFTTLNSGPVLPNGTGGAPTIAPPGAPNAPPPVTPPGGKDLIPGVSNSLLGTGLTALTALSGSQGTEGQTTERKMDPRLDQYVYGPNGTMPMTAGLLQQQFPMAQQGGQSLFNMGQGLLGRGIAANPFTKGR